MDCQRESAFLVSGGILLPRTFAPALELRKSSSELDADPTLEIEIRFLPETAKVTDHSEELGVHAHLCKILAFLLQDMRGRGNFNVLRLRWRDL